MWSKLSSWLCLEKGLLMGSGAVFILMTAPAWIPGMLAALGMAGLWCLGVALLADRQELKACLLPSNRKNQGYSCAALVLLLGFGTNFWNTWRDSAYVGALARLMGIPADLFTAVLAAAAVLLALPGVTVVLRWFLEKALEDYRSAPEGKGKISAPWALAILSGVYILGISAILKANMYYQDDAGRGFYGYKQWDYFGRYLSTALSTLIHGGDYLVDIAPLPQILAMVLMAAASVLVLYILLDRRSFSLWELAAVVPLGLNPWFLECVSFRFDAPYMAVSVLAPILPLLWRNHRGDAYLFAAMLGTLGVCTSYQSATGVFPLLVIALALRLYLQGRTLKDAFRFGLKSLAGYAAGLVYFKLVIMKPADAGYVSNALPGAGDLLGNTIGNFIQYYTLALTDLKIWWLILIAIGIAVALVSGVLASRQKKLPALAVSLAAFGAMGLTCFGIYPVLADTLFAPRAMYGFGVLVAIVMVLAVDGAVCPWGKLPALAISWVFLVFALTYGNVLCLQREYTDFRTELVLSDLQQLEVFRSGEPVTVKITGTIGHTPVLNNMPQEPGILDRLIPDTLAGGNDLAQYRLLGYYGLPNVDLAASIASSGETWKDLPVAVDTAYHTISWEGTQVLVELKQK